MTATRQWTGLAVAMGVDVVGRDLPFGQGYSYAGQAGHLLHTLRRTP